MRMGVRCSIDRSTVGAPRAKDAQVIADIIGARSDSIASRWMSATRRVRCVAT